MSRTFHIRGQGLPEATYTGSCSYGRLDALRAYVKDHMPGWRIISAGCNVGNMDGCTWYKAEVVNEELTHGAVLWVREPY